MEYEVEGILDLSSTEHVMEMVPDAKLRQPASSMRSILNVSLPSTPSSGNIRDLCFLSSKRNSGITMSRVFIATFIFSANPTHCTPDLVNGTKDRQR